MKFIFVVFLFNLSISSFSALHLRVPTGYDNFPIQNEENTNEALPFQLEGTTTEELPSVLIKDNEIQIGEPRFVESTESSEKGQATLDHLYSQALNLINQRNDKQRQTVQTFQIKDEGIVKLDARSKVMIDNEIYSVEEIRRLLKLKRDFEKNKKRV